ncbi:Uma2 family endonuclease [Aquisphaera insulae]|uniref:Uma2 family endonuclease n=1 Tax=Aquisphaera insulae TaxID=2712864 RepID=UPI0013ED9C36|nr:Uma2 family endonuclease [Aquisphaera insulae]
MSTTTTGQPIPSSSPLTAAPPGRISLAEYEGWIDSGAIEEDAPIELFEGRIVRKITKGRRHCASSYHTRRALERILPAGWHVAPEAPVRMPASAGLPEPDLSVTRGAVDDYEVRDPGPADVALVVEVGDSSFIEDRRRAAVFLAEGYPEYWIINVQDRQLEVFRRGSAPEVLAESDVAELILDGDPVGKIAVADMLPRRKAD